MGLTGELAGGGCDADSPVGGVADDADRKVAECCEDAWGGAGSDLGSVFVVGDVAYPVEAVGSAPSLVGTGVVVV